MSKLIQKLVGMAKVFTLAQPKNNSKITTNKYLTMKLAKKNEAKTN